MHQSKLIYAQQNNNEKCITNIVIWHELLKTVANTQL